MTSDSPPVPNAESQPPQHAPSWRTRWWVSLPAAVVLLPALAFVVQIASMPDDAQFWTGLGFFAKGFWPFAGSLAVLLATLGILWALTNRLAIAATVAGILGLILALANCAKLTLLHLPLLPGDFSLGGDVMAVYDRQFLAFGGPGKFALLAAVAIPVCMAIYLLPRVRLRIWSRLVMALAAVGFIASLFVSVANVFGDHPEQFPRFDWDTRRTYSENGFLVGLAMHCRYFSVEAPAGYSEDAVRQLVKDLPPASQSATVKPNVIVILGESFWDVTQLPAVTFPTDPVPTYHRLQREFGQLDLISPTFGCLTCNVEFELLTGMNMAFFPQGTGAYVQWIRRPIPSLASILRQQGYRTIALHAQGGIHNDFQVQPLLGFEQLIPGTQWKNQGPPDSWVPDEVVAREIIEQSLHLRVPYFLCVNTIEGHIPYPNDKYGPIESDIRFDRPMSQESRDMIKVFAHGLHRADQALQSLIDHFAARPEPTLIVFYGDHMPVLGDDRQVYREAGFLPEGEWGEPLSMRRVGAVIWNNFGAKLTPAKRQMGMSNMLPLLLDLTGTPKPPHVRLREKIGSRWPVVSTAGVVDAEGTHILLESVPADDPELRAYRLMQHDILFGNQTIQRSEK